MTAGCKGDIDTLVSMSHRGIDVTSAHDLVSMSYHVYDVY